MAAISNQNKATNKKSLFVLFTEIVGWLQIFVSPFLVGLIIGSIIYFFNPGTTRLIIAVFITITGLFTGIVWANRIWRKKGTIHFMSRIMATPELDKNENLK
jgi:F0F1-type ATP synthase assembly protein I